MAAKPAKGDLSFWAEVARQARGTISEAMLVPVFSPALASGTMSLAA